MKGEKGFTIIELILVIVLIAIISATGFATLSNTSLFTSRFFTDDFLNMLRYARKVASATGCEVALISKHNEIGLYRRAQCTQGDFTYPILSPIIFDSKAGYVISQPKGWHVKELPLYVHSDGKVFNADDRWQKEINLKLNQQHFVIDGFSGFVYEKI